MLRLVVSLLGDKSEEVVSFIFSQEDPAMTVRQGFTLKSVEDKDRNNASAPEMESDLLHPSQHL